MYRFDRQNRLIGCLSFSMNTFFFILLLYFLFVWLFHRYQQKNTYPLSMGELAIFAGLKIAAACAYGYLFKHYYGGDDTWALHFESIKEFHALQQHPLHFFAELGPGFAYNKTGSIGAAIPYWLHHLEDNLLPRLLALINFISRGNYYINATLFSLLLFWGPFLIYRLFCSRFPGRRKLILFFCFLYPPALFWLSGIRADGLIFLFFAVVLSQTSAWLKLKRPVMLWWLVLALIGVLIFRPYMLILLLPALTAWIWTEKKQISLLKPFLVIYGLGVIFFFANVFLAPGRGLSGMIKAKQDAFMSLHGNTRFELTPLNNQPGSYVKAFPQAFLNSFCRPYPWEASGMLQWFTSAAVLFFWLILILFCFKRRYDWRTLLSDSFLLSLLFFSVSLYLIIGYIVPFPGAIVRYKVIGELLMLLPLSLFISFKFKLK